MLCSSRDQGQPAAGEAETGAEDEMLTAGVVTVHSWTDWGFFFCMYSGDA